FCHAPSVFDLVSNFRGALHIWCPLSSQEFQDLPDGAETTLTFSLSLVIMNVLINISHQIVDIGVILPLQHSVFSVPKKLFITALS
ncbi:hypothetical protein, partial [Kosakonia sp. S42]|uniref:hypothetical protein n=1 Tax=Kosakonia sp. S42 TaxID=2767458 RepID=UPI001F3F00D7